MTGGSPPAVETPCPVWCARRHDKHAPGDDNVHVSGALQVRRTLLRLVSTVAPQGETGSGPYVVVGQQPYTLHEAEVLIAALTQLVDEARAATAPEVPRMRTPGP
jgi:hypothetical protein